MAAAMALGIGVMSSAAPAEDLGKATSSQLDASRLTYARLYCTSDNESHFGEVTAELIKQDFAPPAASIYIGGNRPASSVFFAGFRGALGRGRLGQPSLPSYPCSSAAHGGRGPIFNHNHRWSDKTAAPRRRRSSEKTSRLAKGTLP